MLAIGLAVVIAIADLALREWRRTNRVLNVGLTVAGLAVLASVAWWAVAAITTDVRIGGARAHTGAGAALDDARIAVLQARSNESLVLVARNSGGGSSDDAFSAQLDDVVNNFGLLADAERADPELADRVAALRGAATAWSAAHRDVRRLDDGGQYPQAVASVVGHGPGSSGAAFDALDAALGRRDRRGAGRVRGRRRGGGGGAGRAAVDLGGAGAGRGGRRDRRDRTTGG